MKSSRIPLVWSVRSEEEEEKEEEEEEKTREIRTLNFFPVLENQEKTDWFAEKKKANANRMCYNYRYYYEFMPLKKN